MPDTWSRDGTLPAIDTADATTGEWRGLYLTLVFHPDPELIGAACSLFADADRRQNIGREHPVFRHGDAASEFTLGDRHISRLALSLHLRPEGLRLSRPDGASRCLVDGMPLSGSLTLSPTRLAAGVTLQLAHSVVLLLREQPRCQEGAPAVAAVEGLLGGSQSMRQLRQAIHRAAAVDRDVLVLGESGSGKEGVARALHRASSRSGGPWVAVNMSAVPVGVAAAELFGSERGAFTGADRQRRGYFQRAEGGTLFLDEVGDTPPEVQPLLLRALQEREIQPVGGEARQVDLRVIAATELDLDDAERGFRSSLRYRLAGLEVRVPALRERPEDIGELLCHALAQSCTEMGHAFPLGRLTQDPRRAARWASLFARCLQHTWPGNVRELQSCARQLALAAERGPMLPSMLASGRGGAVNEPCHRDSDAVPVKPGPEQTAAPLTDAALRALLAEYDYDLAAVSRAAGVSRGSLYRRLPGLGLRLARDIPRAEIERALAAESGDVAAAARALKVSRAALQARCAAREG